MGRDPHPKWGGNVPWQAGRRFAGEVSCALRFWCPQYGGGEEIGGEVRWRGRGRLPLLPEEVEACTVFPLGVGHADAELWNPAPPDAAVGGPCYSDFHSTLHVPTGTWVRIFPLLRKAAGDVFKTCSRPRRAVIFHSLVFRENSLLIVEIGPIRDKELKFIFDKIDLILRTFIVR